MVRQPGYQRAVSGEWQRLRGRVVRLAFAALVVLPLVAGAHFHGFAPDAARSCGLCAVVKHAPAMAAPALAALPSVLHAGRVAEAPPPPLGTGKGWRSTGRAPPALSSVQT